MFAEHVCEDFIKNYLLGQLFACARTLISSLINHDLHYKALQKQNRSCMCTSTWNFSRIYRYFKKWRTLVVGLSPHSETSYLSPGRSSFRIMTGFLSVYFELGPTILGFFALGGLEIKWKLNKLIIRNQVQVSHGQGRIHIIKINHCYSEARVGRV